MEAAQDRTGAWATYPCLAVALLLQGMVCGERALPGGFAPLIPVRCIRRATGREQIREVSRQRILFIVLCLLVGSALLYVGTVGDSDLRLVVGGGFFVVMGIGAGLLMIGHLLPGRAGAALRDIRVIRLVFWTAVGLMVLVIAVSLSRQGG